ncbi:MAG: UDP-N-acetylmuramate dehydrogenase [Candidatus Saccharibacteria bacterium]
MDIHTNIPLKNYITMKLGGNARFMTEVHTPQEVADVYNGAKEQSLPVFILGGGSNVIVRDEGFNGVVARMRIPGFEIIADDSTSTTIHIGAGENWDSVVKRSVEMGLSGIEAMSGIPGTAGATPVQNVGAYGQEIADTLVSVDAYDSLTNNFGVLPATDCNFTYRDSIFRSDAKGRYIITAITLKLSKNQPQPPFYDSLQKYFDEHNMHIFTSQIVRDIVIQIRNSKLPNPATSPNTGSFFKNAIVDKWQIDGLKAINPNIPLYEMADGTYKIPAGWLIENCGLKGQLIHGMRVYENNALVLVNESATSYLDLEMARNEIVGKVRDTFRVQIEQEPLEI